MFIRKLAILATCLLLLAVSAQAAPQIFTIKKKAFKKLDAENKISCVYKDGKYFLAYYISQNPVRVKNLTTLIRYLVANGLTSEANALKALRTEYADDCTGLNRIKSKLKAKGLKVTPDNSDIVEEGDDVESNSLSIPSNLAKILSVSGTPPALSEIAADAENLFWEAGLISAINSDSANGAQCSDYFAGDVDGDSAGEAGCRMAQNAASSFSSLLEAGTSSCYMKGLANTSLLNEGISLVSGVLPAAGLNNIFKPNNASTKRIKIDAGDEDVIIEIPSITQNTIDGNSYKAKLFFCPSVGADPVGSEQLEIRLNGQIISTNKGLHGGDSVHKSEVNAYIIPNEENAIIFDPTQMKVINVSGTHQSENVFKSNIVIDGAQMTSKSYDIHSEMGHTNSHKSVSITNIEGSSVADLKFLEGAFQGEFSFDESDTFNHSVGIEFRDTAYVSAPSNALLTTANSHDLSSGFWSNPPVEPNIEVNNFNCETAEIDIEIAMDFDHANIQSIQSACEAGRFEYENYCEPVDRNTYQNSCNS